MRAPSIRRRLSLWFAAQTFFGLSVVCLAVYLVTAWNFGAKQDTEIAHKAELVQHLLGESERAGDLSTLRHKLEDFFSMEDEFSLSIVTATGDTIFRSTPPTGCLLYTSPSPRD
mgnify:FL=1